MLPSFNLHLGVGLGVGVVGAEEASMILITMKGELKSSSSSSLVFDFLNTDDPVRPKCFLHTATPSPLTKMLFIIDDADGGS